MKFLSLQPILGTRDIHRAALFYSQKLGFELAFTDKSEPLNYIGFRRDGVEIHMQFQYEHEMSTTRLRFLVDDPEELFQEYQGRGVRCSERGLWDTPWGTQEFALYDLDQNALTFYQHLKS